MKFRVKKLVSNVPNLAENTLADFKSVTNLIELDKKLYVSSDGEAKEFSLKGELIRKISANGAPFSIDYIAVNDSKFFVIEKDGKKAASDWISCCGNGISGYNKNLDPVKTVDIDVDDYFTACSQKGDRLYLINSYDDGDGPEKQISIYDGQFKFIKTEGKLPNNVVPKEYVNYNIRIIDDEIFVTYLQIDTNGEEDQIISGEGLGYIAVFDLEGKYLRLFTSQGKLNAPSDIVKAPKCFSKFGCSYLVSNYGDGKINAYNKKGEFLGTLKDKHKKDIVLNRLNGLYFYEDKLYFVSSPITTPSENNGLLGYIKKC